LPTEQNILVHEYISEAMLTYVQVWLTLIFNTIPCCLQSSKTDRPVI